MKTAVVTGGARGIGLEVVKKFLAEGYKVAVLSNMDAEIEGATVYKCDVSDFGTVEAIAKKIAADFGGVDVLVNNAGITRDNLAILMKEEEFDSVIAVNLKGVFNCCRHFMRYIMKSSAGRIINLSSVSGLHGNAGQVNYAASKAGVIAITKTLARELGGKGVTVNAIAPGFIQTDMTAVLSDEIRETVKSSTLLKKLGTMEDVANAVLFLASEGAGYITGHTLVIDGGLTA